MCNEYRPCFLSAIAFRSRFEPHSDNHRGKWLCLFHHKMRYVWCTCNARRFFSSLTHKTLFYEMEYNGSVLFQLNSTCLPRGGSVCVCAAAKYIWPHFGRKTTNNHPEGDFIDGVFVRLFSNEMHYTLAHCWIALHTCVCVCVCLTKYDRFFFQLGVVSQFTFAVSAWENESLNIVEIIRIWFEKINRSTRII